MEGPSLIGFIMLDSSQYLKCLFSDDLEVTTMILLFSSSLAYGIAMIFFLIWLAWCNVPNH